MNDIPKQAGQKPSKVVNLPYFDYLLAVLKEGNTAVEKSFGRHVHWGYWETPKLASLTSEDFGQAAENLCAEVCAAASVQNGLKLLDVGCGFGGTIAHINERFSGMDLVGLNLDERQLQRARELVKPLADNRLEFQQGNACTLPFPDQSFDVVMAVECIFHFPDRKQFFKEAYRVLKPDGYLALSDFVASKQLRPFTKLRLHHFGFYGKCNLEFGTQQYRQLAAETQFNIEVARNITANTLPTYSYLRRLARQESGASLSAVFETLSAELLSKLGLLHYFIYGFRK